MRLTHPHGSPSHSLRQLFVPINELSCFGSFGVFLTSSCSCGHFHIDSSTLRVRVPDASAWFLGPCGSSGRSSGLLAGESNLVQRFWNLLMRSDLFSGLCQSLTTLCTCIHAFHASVRFSSLSGSPMHDTVPLAGKLEVTDEFSSRSQCSARVCIYPTRPFDFPTFVARPCAVLHL